MVITDGKYESSSLEKVTSLTFCSFLNKEITQILELFG